MQTLEHQKSKQMQSSIQVYNQCQSFCKTISFGHKNNIDIPVMTPVPVPVPYRKITNDLYNSIIKSANSQYDCETFHFKIHCTNV